MVAEEEPASQFSFPAHIVSLAAVFGVVARRSSPLAAARERDTFLSLKLTNKKQVSIFWKPGLSPFRLLDVANVAAKALRTS